MPDNLRNMHKAEKNPHREGRTISRSSSSNLRTRGSKKLLSPFTADSLKATDDVSANSARFSLFQSTIPIASFNPPSALFAAFLFATELGNEFPGGP